MTAQCRLALAPLYRRMLSLIYEALLIVAVLWFAAVLYALAERQFDWIHIRVAHQAYLGTIAGVYFVWQWRRGQTLPMKTWRMRLVTRSGVPLSLAQAVARYLFASAGLLLFGFGFLWAFVDPDRQFVHDRLAGTRVVSD